jgi:hypothetical protein
VGEGGTGVGEGSGVVLTALEGRADGEVPVPEGSGCLQAVTKTIKTNSAISRFVL